MNDTPEYFEWLDHCEPHNDNVWWSPADLATLDGPTIVKTVGWAVAETDTWVAVVGQLCPDGYTGQPVVIVKSCLIARRKLKTPK